MQEVAIIYTAIYCLSINIEMVGDSFVLKINENYSESLHFALSYQYAQYTSKLGAIIVKSNIYIANLNPFGWRHIKLFNYFWFLMIA